MRNFDKRFENNFFGYWKEYGEEFNSFPSIFEYVDNVTNLKYDKSKLINYLNNGVVVAITSAIGFPSPFDGNVKYGSIAIRTDGEWYWLENISEFIEKNNLFIPEKFYVNICKNNFSVPLVKGDNLPPLELTILE